MMNMWNPWMQMQQAWLKSMSSMASFPMAGLPNVCMPQTMTPANPMQQMMESWQRMWMPQAAQATNQWPSPKITVMTVELGDLKAYMEPAMAMLNMWQGALNAPNSYNQFWQSKPAGRA